MSRALILTAADELAAGRPYAERSEREHSVPDRIAEYLQNAVTAPLHDLVQNPARRLRRIVDQAGRHEEALRRAGDAELKAQAQRMRARLRQRGFAADLVGECFALIREAATRTIGQRHYDTQLMGGWALLQGKLVEMETGEGKTIAATLPAGTVALAGYPVHVITVNDYLAQRDAEEMGPLYKFLGLSVGLVVQGMPKPARRQAYAQSITHCSNKELAFDYLRDRAVLARRSSRLHLALEKLRGNALRDEELVLRGLYYAIVDEADSVFIDEARTPLILSSNVGPAEEQEVGGLALDFARRLDPDTDYTIDLVDRTATLTGAGRAELAALAAGMAGTWSSVRACEDMVTQAITALTLFHRDHHYVVTDGKVQIVDESTGRVMPDRSWERGLHQLIEIKEGCEPTQQRETLARLTYQRLFRRYMRLAGMSGTASEVAREIKSVYGLGVVRIPLHRPSRREYGPSLVCATRAGKWDAVAEIVERLAIGRGRPVLIGTRSVGASEEISALLAGRGIEHTLLNAKQDSSEADIVALAGQPARVTVATNIAGRGTDIRLGPGVAERGGLHVILTEYHESRRIDRQLFGRCARQGDRGSCEAVVSLEDEIYTVYAPAATRWARRLAAGGRPPPLAASALRRIAQYAAERRSAAQRVQNLKQDRRLERMLAFSGRSE